MTRVGTVVLVAAIAIAASAIYVLKLRTPDDIRTPTPSTPGITDTPARPAASRNDSAPAPRVADARRPSSPAATRRTTPTPAAPVESPAPTPAPVTGTLRIVSDVPGAQVFLNRAFVGATPATAADLAPGSYQLNVSAPGYDNHVETIEVSAGDREVSVRFREVRLDAAIAVIHKHRIGSCRGRLVATADGVRYETTDKDDAFASSLLNLETFQVDYLNKNLRIQPRRGKRYDFTDPDGNADRLFVFHRDVEHARERLKKGETP